MKVWIGIAVGVTFLARSVPVLAQTDTLTGRLSVIWVDPVVGAPELRLFIAEDVTNATELRLDAGFQFDYTELHRMDGKLVTAIGSRVLAVPASGQAAEPFRAGQLQLDEPTVGGAGLVSGPLLSGPQPWITILCRFGDLPGITPHPPSYYQSLLAGTGSPTLDHYWRENSYDNISLTGSAVVDRWFDLPQPKSYYVYDADGDGQTDYDLGRLAADCTAAADAVVNFNDFVGFNMIFNATFGDKNVAVGGGYTLTLDGTTKAWRMTWMPIWGDYPGIYAHEMGHAFGFPHSSGGYGAVYDSKWDPMSYINGPPAPSPFTGVAGQHTITYHKDLNGWIPASRLLDLNVGASTSVILERTSQPTATSSYLMVKIPIDHSPRHFYTVEARRLVGYDSALPGPGVIIHEVVTARSEPAHVVDPDNNGDPNDAGAMWTTGETFVDVANGIRVSVVSESATEAVIVVTNAGIFSQTRFSTLAGKAGSFGGTDGTGSAARFNRPSGLVVDSAGTAYVVDSDNLTIRKITSAGVVTTLAGVAGSFGTADGTGSAARFGQLDGIGIDTAGALYVADFNTIRKITPAGVVTTLAGMHAAGATDGSGSAARFNLPSGIAVDSSGTLYVTDNQTVRIVTAAGVVTTLAGMAGSPGKVDGTGVTARFNYPKGIAVDSAGNVFVADSNNHAIRKITPAGVVTTLAGGAGGGSVDGTGPGARFYFPWGLAIDTAGALYVTDYAGQTIRKVTPAGVVTTIAGLAFTAGSTDGLAEFARFSNPQGIAVDALKNLYIVDTANHTIRAAVETHLSVSTVALRFGATKLSAGGALTSVTPAQDVTVSLASGSTAWTVTANQPWVQITNGSGTGSGRFNVAIVDPNNAIGGATNLMATITLGAPGVSITTTLSVWLTVQIAPATSAAFGSFDTPAAGATGVIGAIPVTGWALDDIVVDRVELWRNCVEAIDRARGACAAAVPGGPANFVFIGRGVFLAGARPDVETTFPTSPLGYRAGWGYLMLTNALPHVTRFTPEGGQGTFALSAYAVDAESHYTLLGTKTVTLDNDHATIPFGNLDTPEQGATVPGSAFPFNDPAAYPVFGWGMTQVGKCITTTNTASYRMYIDGVLQPLTPGTNWFAGLNRPDIAAAFPGLCNSTNGLAAYYMDVRPLANGLHTIGWDVIDGQGNIAGIGSRFFIVAR